MKRKGLLYSSVALMAVAGAGVALADLSYTQGSGTTIFDFTCFTSKHCPVHTVVNSAGTEINTTTNPAVVAQSIAGSTLTAPPSQWQTVSTSTGTVQMVNSYVANASNEPCLNKKTNITISTTAANTALVAGAANQKIYICSFSVLTSSATAVNLLEGINASCTATSTALLAVMGSTVASHGLSIPDSGGLTYGSGIGSVAATQTSSNFLCLVQSGTGTLAGNISVVQTSN